MRAATHRRGLAVLAALLLMTSLAACSPPLDPGLDLSAEGIGSMDCQAAQQAEAAVNRLAEGNDAIGEAKQNWLAKHVSADGNIDVWLNTKSMLLNERIEEACSNDEPAADTAETTSAVSTTAATPSPDSTTQWVGWDDVIQASSSELEQLIEEHSSVIGFDWDDVQHWAEVKLPSGDLIDARIVLVSGDRLSDADARRAAEPGSDASEVPVLRVASCNNVVGDGCPGDGSAQVILAPLAPNGKLAVGEGLAPQSEALLTYTVKQS